MKLYYAPGACSLSAHIVAREAGIPLELIKVDIVGNPHRIESGADYAAINPKGYVPVLELDNGERLTENAAILQYLADLAPDAGLAPPAGTPERYRLQEWLHFIGSELHKMYSPWLFHAETGELAQRTARDRIALRLAFIDRWLANRAYLLGERFSAADAYCFTIVSWSKLLRVDLAPYPHVGEYLKRVAARPRVREALEAEGLLPSKSAA